jgi:hypothetical protein
VAREYAGHGQDARATFSLSDGAVRPRDKFDGGSPAGRPPLNKDFLMRIVQLSLMAALICCIAGISRAEDKPLSIPAVSGIKVDGSLSEWEKLPSIGDWNENDHVVWGRPNFAGPNDLGGRAWMGWDAKNLYVAADVIDDQHVQQDTGENIYRGDNVMVLLQTDRTSTRYFQIGLSPGSLSNSGDILSQLPPEAWVWQPQYVQGSGIVVAAAKTAKGYIIEAAIPWSFLKTQPAAGLRLGFDLCASDSDNAGTGLQTLASLKPGKWEISTARLLEGVLSGTVSPQAAVTAKPVVLSRPEVKLHPNQERTFKFPAPADAHGLIPVLSLRAHIAYPKLAGASYGLDVVLNGKALGPDRAVNRPASVTFASGGAQPLYYADSWTLFYSPGYQTIQQDTTSDYYIASNSFEASLYSFDVHDLIKPADNTLTIRFGAPPGMKDALAFKDVRIHWVSPDELAARQQQTQAKYQPVVVTAPTLLHAPIDVKLANGGAVQFAAIGKQWVIDSQFSEPDGGWRKFEAAPDRGWAGFSHISATKVSAHTSRYSVTQEVTMLKEGIEIHDTLKNLTDQPQPVMIRHTLHWPLAKLAELTLNGRPIPMKRGLAQNAMNPTILLKSTDGGGLAMAAVDDAFRVHNQAFYLSDTAGLADPSLVLAPGATYEQVWQVYAVPSGSYWDMLNAIRRQWDVNFTIPGPMEFVDPRHPSPQAKMSVAEMRQWLDRHNGGIPTIIMYNSVTGANIQGLQFVDQLKGEYLADLKAMVAKIHAARPDLPVGHYFHCFLTGRSSAAEADPADALIGPDGQQAFYGGDKASPIFLPTTHNRYGRQMTAMLKEMVAKLGLGAIFWDEQDYSDQQYDYNSRLWDGVSGDIDPSTHKLIRKKSSVPILSGPFRYGLMQWIVDQKLILTCNCPPMTRTAMQFKVRRITETGSITNLYDTHLFTPIGLGDHLTERTSADTVRGQMEFLDRGCLYDYYNSDIDVKNPGLCRWMSPITPIALGPGYILAKEKILTTHPGLFSWGDKTLPPLEVHEIDATGNIVPAKFVRVQQDGIEWIKLTLPADHAAAIVRE